MRLRRSLPPLLAIALSVLLSGCFVSAEPKFALSTAVAALGEGGRYGAYERKEDGRYEKTETLVLRRRPDGGYDFTAEKGATETVTFHALPSGLYVAQSKQKEGYGYALVRVAGNEVLVHVTACDKQDKTKLARLGVEFRGQYECVIDRVSDLTGLFAAIDLGEAGSKLVRE